MSGVFKAVGKVFKGVVKVIKKVALPALAIGAIVLTGGAAIGALPAIGSLLGSIGITGGLATALGSAVTSAGIGGAIGLATGGVKGMVKGAVIGGLSGGILGAAGAPISLTGGGGAAAAAQNGTINSLVASNNAWLSGAASAGSAASGIGTSIINSVTGGLIPAASAATSAAPSFLGAGAITGATTTASGAGGGGVLSNLLGNQGLLGSVLNGIGTGMAEKDAAKAALQRDQAQRDYYTANYGVDPKSGQVSGLLANYANNNQPLSFDTSPASLQFQSPGRFEYDKTKRKVVFVPASQPQQQQVA